MAFYKKRIVRPDTDQDILDRAEHRRAAERALADMRAEFPILTSNNFNDADNYRTARIQHYLLLNRLVPK